MRRTLRASLVTAAVGLVAAAVAGCGDDAPEAADEAPAEAPEVEQAPVEDPDAASASLEEVLARFGDGPIGSGQVVYDWDFADVEMMSDARMTIAQDPPRFAYLLESAEGSFLTILGDDNVSCFDQDDGWQCMSADTGADGTIDDPFDDVYEVDDLNELGFDPATATITTETIVGRSAVCIEVPETDEVTDMVMCLDEETGMMLRASGQGSDGGYHLEAISFSPVDPDMFVPPAEPMELPEMPGLEDMPDLEGMPEMPDLEDMPGMEHLPEIPTG